LRLLPGAMPQRRPRRRAPDPRPGPVRLTRENQFSHGGTRINPWLVHSLRLITGSGNLLRMARTNVRASSIDSCASSSVGSQGAPGYRNLAAYSVKGVTSSTAAASVPSMKRRVVPRKESLHRLLDCLLAVKQSVPNKGRSCHQIMLRIVQILLGAQKPFPGVRDKDRVRLHTAVSLPERWWMEMMPSGATAC
jgi:hypothetical protein